MTTRALLLAASLLAVSAAHAQTTEPLREIVHEVGGWLALSATGEPLAFEPDPAAGMAAPLVEAIRGQAMALEYVPARVGDAPAPSRSWLSATLRLVPEDGQYSVRLEDARLGPRLAGQARLQAPRGLRDQSVDVIVCYRVTPEGRASDFEFDTKAPGQRQVATSAVMMLRSLRFEPEQVAGQPVATPRCLPFRYVGSNDPGTAWQPAPRPMFAGRPHVAGQDGNERPMEITRVRRGERRMPGDPARDVLAD